MAKKEEAIFIQIDNDVFELKDEEKKAFIEQLEKENAEVEKIKAKEKELKALKISAYTKLGLTEEEINAIL